MKATADIDPSFYTKDKIYSEDNSDELILHRYTKFWVRSKQVEVVGGTSRQRRVNLNIQLQAIKLNSQQAFRNIRKIKPKIGGDGKIRQVIAAEISFQDISKIMAKSLDDVFYVDLGVIDELNDQSVNIILDVWREVLKCLGGVEVSRDREGGNCCSQDVACRAGDLDSCCQGNVFLFYFSLAVRLD